MRRTAWVGLVMIGLAAVLPHTSTAQNEETTEQTPQVKQPRGPLPFYFGKLGLSESQRERLYAIQDSYDEKIAPLERQIEQLKQERDASMEMQLTPGQKLRLQELREEARLQQETSQDAVANTGEKSETAP